MDVTTLSSVAVDDIPVIKISLEQCHQVTTKIFAVKPDPVGAVCCRGIGPAQWDSPAS